jgi:hypothetical protein
VERLLSIALVVQGVSSGLATPASSNTAKDGVALATNTVGGARGISLGLGGADLCGTATLARIILLSEDTNECSTLALTGLVHDLPCREREPKFRPRAGASQRQT